MHWMVNFMIFAFFSSPNGQQFQKPYFDSNTIIDDEKDSISVDSVDSSDIPEMSPSELQEQSSGLPIYENPVTIIICYLTSFPTPFPSVVLTIYCS